MLNDQQPPETEQKRKLHPLEERPERLARVPIEDAQSTRPSLIFRVPLIQPIVTYVLLAINIVVFALGTLNPDVQISLFTFGVSSPREVLLGGDYYRLITAMFLHGGLMHIFFNAYALYVIGAYVERLFGHARFAVIYLLGGVAGSILSVIMGDLGQNIGSVGASGAVFAIFGAEMVYLYRHRELLGQRGRDQLRNLLVLLAVNFFIGVVSGVPGARVRIDNWAHLGGLLGGLVLTWFIGPRFVAAPHPAAADTLVADDTNPIQTKYWAISLYVIVLVGVLAVVTLSVR
jgi:rhomboid protease GluP